MQFWIECVRWLGSEGWLLNSPGLGEVAVPLSSYHQVCTQQGDVQVYRTVL